jgi:exodeoxyribonuclease-3
LAKIATWNVNSIKARLPHVLEWLKAAEPDVLCLQEIKCIAENFPTQEFEDAGYSVVVCGQKTYNGVAIAARGNLEDVRTGLPGEKGLGGSDDIQARYIEAAIDLDGTMVRVASIYTYKLDWMDSLKAHAANLLSLEEPIVLAGDYNVIPEDGDVYDPDRWQDDALFRLEVRRKFREILYLGYTEAYRTLHQEVGRYSFWDYQGGAWQKGFGLRIDHLLLSAQAVDLLDECEIDSGPRGKPKASDHTPVWCTLAP